MNTKSERKCEKEKNVEDWFKKIVIILHEHVISLVVNFQMNKKICIKTMQSIYLFFYRKNEGTRRIGFSLGPTTKGGNGPTFPRPGLKCLGPARTQ